MNPLIRRPPRPLSPATTPGLQPYPSPRTHHYSRRMYQRHPWTTRPLIRHGACIAQYRRSRTLHHYWSSRLTHRVTQLRSRRRPERRPTGITTTASLNPADGSHQQPLIVPTRTVSWGPVADPSFSQQCHPSGQHHRSGRLRRHQIGPAGPVGVLAVPSHRLIAHQCSAPRLRPGHHRHRVSAGPGFHRPSKSTVTTSTPPRRASCPARPASRTPHRRAPRYVRDGTGPRRSGSKLVHPALTVSGAFCHHRRRPLRHHPGHAATLTFSRLLMPVTGPVSGQGAGRTALLPGASATPAAAAHTAHTEGTLRTLTCFPAAAVPVGATGQPAPRSHGNHAAAAHTPGTLAVATRNDTASQCINVQSLCTLCKICK